MELARTLETPDKENIGLMMERPPNLIYRKAKLYGIQLMSKPSAIIPPSPIFRRLQSFFTVSMIEDWGGIFGLVFLWPWDIGRLIHSPNIFWYFGYGWYHGRKLRKACAMMLLNYIISLIKFCTSLKKVDRFEGFQLNRVYTYPKRVYIHH